jgi:regulatory protein
LSLGDQQSKAKSMLMRYLSYRARTGKEAHNYLAKKGFSDKLICSVIKEMKERNYINDESFTRDFISYRKARQYGPKRIRFELLNKGLKKDQVDLLLDSEKNDEQEPNTIRELLNRRVPTDGITDQRWLARQVSFLQRRGFREYLIFKVLRDYGFFE